MKIIFISARARTGKNTLADMIYDYETQKRKNCAFLHFSRPLKQALNAFYGDPHLHWNHWDNNRNDPQEFFQGKSFREAIMDFAENIVKPKFGKDFYARLFNANVNQQLFENLQGDIVNYKHTNLINTLIVPDLGYPEELPYVNKISFSCEIKIFLLSRKAAEGELDNRHIFNKKDLNDYFERNRPPQHAIPSPQIFNIANDGSLKDLRENINAILSNEIA